MVLKAYLHDDLASGLATLHERLQVGGPWDLLVVDRVWSRDVLRDLVAAAGGCAVVVNHWASVAAWPEVSFRISPLSRRALTALVEAGPERWGDPAAPIPNLHRRDPDGRWVPPPHSDPLSVATELGAPLDLAYDAAEVIGLSPEEAGSTRYLVMNMGCPYRGAPNTSAFLDGLSLPTAWGDRGCTFCNVGPYERQSAAERRALMDTQLAALAKRGTYERLVVQDEYIFRDLDTLVERLLAHGASGVEVMVRARVEYIESCEPQLVRALELLGDRGTITPYLIGFENFADAELARYNKGQTGADAEAAIARLDALAERWPGLRMSPSQGFILFGPWTTLEDLDANVAAFRRVGFQRFRGRITRSKLRLNPDAALVARARADGLLVEAHARPDEDNAADAGYQAELPYRFQSPAVASVWELLNGPRPLAGRGGEVDRLSAAIAQVRAGIAE